MENKNKVEQLKDMLKAKKEAEGKKAAEEKAEEKREESPVSADEMTAQIQAAEDEAKAHYDKLLRVMAEFENFKKRMERERIEQVKFSAQNIISDILLVLDDLDRVLDHVPKGAPCEVVAIIDGVKLIQNHLMNALSKHGLVSVEPSVGAQFDPNIHEAVSHIESAAHPANTVVAEHRKGYKLYDRLIRPASVTVAKGKNEN